MHFKFKSCYSKINNFVKIISQSQPVQTDAFDAEIKSALAYDEKFQWSEAEEHAMSAIKLNKIDERVSICDYLTFSFIV